MDYKIVRLAFSSFHRLLFSSYIYLIKPSYPPPPPPPKFGSRGTPSKFVLYTHENSCANFVSCTKFVTIIDWQLKVRMTRPDPFLYRNFLFKRKVFHLKYRRPGYETIAGSAACKTCQIYWQLHSSTINEKQLPELFLIKLVTWHLRLHQPDYVTYNTCTF